MKSSGSTKNQNVSTSNSSAIALSVSPLGIEPRFFHVAPVVGFSPILLHNAETLSPLSLQIIDNLS